MSSFYGGRTTRGSTISRLVSRGGRSDYSAPVFRNSRSSTGGVRALREREAEPDPGRLRREPDRGNRQDRRTPRALARDLGGCREAEHRAVHSLLPEEFLEDRARRALGGRCLVPDERPREQSSLAQDELRALRHVVGGDGDPLLASDRSVPSEPQDVVPRDGTVQRKPRRVPAAQPAVEEERLVRVDEEQPELSGEGAEGTLCRVSLREALEQRAFEPVVARKFLKGPIRVVGLGVGPPGRVAEPVGGPRRKRDQVHLDGRGEVPSHDLPSHLVGDRPHLAEPLRPEEVRPVPGGPKLLLGRSERLPGLRRRHEELVDPDLERVAKMVAEDEPVPGRVRLEHDDPGEPQVTARKRAPVGEQTFGDRPTVLRARPLDRGGRQAEAPRDRLSQFVLFPVTALDPEDGEGPERVGYRIVRDLGHPEVVGRALRPAGDPGGSGRIELHAERPVLRRRSRNGVRHAPPTGVAINT